MMVGAAARASRLLRVALESLKDIAANSLYARRVGAWFASQVQHGPLITQRLGFAPDTRLLIINADDFGLCREQNLAITQGLQSGSLSSASLMVPCPGFDEAREYCLNHPEVDIGIHLTLTSEWDALRWGPVSSTGKVPSLVDDDGRFWRSGAEVFSLCRAEEAEAELRAQIERALAAGLDITHLDSHMFILHSGQETLQQVYLKLAREYSLPLRAAPRTLMHWQGFDSVPDEADRMGILHPDHFAVLSRVHPSRATFFWTALLRHLPPGLTEICCHPAYASPELACFAADAPQREADLRFLTSDAARRMIEASEIELVGYRFLRDAMRSAPSN